MLNILVTGSNGQLGSEIRELSTHYPYQFFFTNRAQLDMCDGKAIEQFIITHNINAIVNCAAYTAVDKAEIESEKAYDINANAVKTLASLSKKYAMKLVHISTDYVFDGTHFQPYAENHTTNPLSVYGKSKCAGEEALLEANPTHAIIIRTSWIYSHHGTNFVKTIFRIAKEKKALNVVFDQISTPTYAKDLAYAILEILPKIDNNMVEIYHYSNEGVASWYDFAKEIVSCANISCKIEPITTEHYPLPAKRPYYSLLNKSKIKQTFGLKIPYWKDSLKAYFQNKKILITGSRGFIGAHLKNELLQTANIQIFEYTRDNTIEDIESYIEKIDFIYHLAGEVNPRSDSTSFIKGNIEITEQIIALLERKKLKIPLLLASSIHAKYPKNDYGITKQKSEELILEYGNRHNVPVYIYRLPHLFGQNCKPNYNSVISTWIYNSINNLEINIFDRNIKMHYSYVKDIVKEFACCLESKAIPQGYLEPRIVYETSLGEVVDFIEEFKSNVNNKHYFISKNEFKQKLFETFLDYAKTRI